MSCAWWCQTLRFLTSKIPSIFFRSSSLSSPSSCSSPRVLHGPLPTPSRSSSSTAPLESRFQRHEISGCKTEPSGLALKRKRPMMMIFQPSLVCLMDMEGQKQPNLQPRTWTETLRIV
ncbi:putative protein phosphatase 2C 25 [Prunus yedoensis var. nudiflora]|uniref:Uncharacterized protein n=1 Tax=Prunus yedoensis var. nudiflora TaxID=2094558 RepID=A0A314XXX0_PRUYE|nr:putative protein phosphatase 2C 25 [Prunus yedoensis var. nudiflora]